MKYLPPAAGVVLGVTCLLGAAYAYYLSSQKTKGKDKTLSVGIGILLTVLGLLFPLLGFNEVVLRKLRGRKMFFKASGNNGLTVPQATLFS